MYNFIHYDSTSPHINITYALEPIYRTQDFQLSMEPTGGFITLDNILAHSELIIPAGLTINKEPYNVHTTQEQLNFIRDTLALNITELAKILQISRPTAYAWIEGTQEPKPAALKTIQQLIHIAEKIKQLNILRIDTLMHRPIFSDHSFFYKLCTSNMEDILHSLNTIKKLSDKEIQNRLKIKGSEKNKKPFKEAIDEYSNPFYPDRS